MKKSVKLKDGSEIVIREIREDDIDRSLAFFRSLPEEDREYLRVDVTNREIVERRIETVKWGRVMRLVAVADDQIVADGALELPGEGWEQHHAELRLIVARRFQRKGLGLLMARELYGLAASRKVEEIIVKFMETQAAARKIFEKLGFHEDAVFHNYVKDLHGRKHDQYVMRCDLEALWKKMDDYLADGDWQRTR
jgi:ribosomal protein S18 acetylase RimI-like enzyme